MVCWQERIEKRAGDNHRFRQRLVSKCAKLVVNGISCAYAPFNFFARSANIFARFPKTAVPGLTFQPTSGVPWAPGLPYKGPGAQATSGLIAVHSQKSSSGF